MSCGKGKLYNARCGQHNVLMCADKNSVTYFKLRLLQTLIKPTSCGTVPWFDATKVAGSKELAFIWYAWIHSAIDATAALKFLVSSSRTNL